MKPLLTFAAAALIAGIPATQANAATLIIDVSGINSVGEQGDTGNTVQSYNIGAGSIITGIAYDVTLEAFSPSWLSELVFSFQDSNQSAGVFLTPGFADSFSGVGSYADAASLVDLGLSFAVGADGILRTEFFEGFDDSGISPDGVWQSGTITITYDTVAGAIPEPATWGLMILGFGAIGGAMRRRRTTTSVRFA